MKFFSKSNLIWAVCGLFAGIAVSAIASYFMYHTDMKEMAPVDVRDHKFDGVMLASHTSTPSTVSTYKTPDGFYYSSTETFPVNDRFFIKMENKDPKMLVKDFGSKPSNPSLSVTV